jgi:choline kinase
VDTWHSEPADLRMPRHLKTLQRTAPAPAPDPDAPIAILLAAGVGHRLAGAHHGPKILLAMGGRTLLERHLQALAAADVHDVVVTVGFEADRLREALQSRAATVNNPEFHRGSLVSLSVQDAVLRSGRPVLLMDGDVLYDPRMLRRLVQAQGDAILLVDRKVDPGDEPVKVCFRDDVIVDFRKRPERVHDWHGESVGFFKFSPAMARALADRCQALLAAGRGDLEYEEAIRDLLLERPQDFTYLDISDLPWTEIDFPEDVIKARDQVLPALAG